MTPTQRTKCDLLGISIIPWATTIRLKSEPNDGWYVTLDLPNNMWAVLCVPEDGIEPVKWATKRFLEIDEAIEAASNPSKFGLAWDN